METRKHKKFYAYTDKHKRKKRSGGRESIGGSAPKSYRKPFWDVHRALEKEGIHKLMKGLEYNHFPYHHRNSASWHYW